MTARPLQFDKDMLSLLQKVHVSIRCKALDRYMEMILRYRMNLEIVFEASQLDEVPHPRMKTLAAQLHKNGIRVTFHGPFLDLCLGSIDPLVRQVSRHRLQQCVDLFDIFQPIQMVCHTGYDPNHHRGLRDQWLKRSLAVWEELLPQAEKLNVVLLMENVWEHDPLLHQETSRHLHSSHFGFCLDVGHQNCFSRTPLVEWVEALGDALMELHLHDNDGSGDAHLPVGQGNIDFPGLFQLLRQKQRRPLLTLEPHSQEHLTESLGGLLQVMGADL